MSEQTSTDVTSDDKLWAALAYVFSPVVPIIILMLEDKKDRLYIKAHNMQALVYGIILFAVASVLSFFLIGCCIGVIGWVVQLYWGYKAYQGELVTIPVVTDFVKKQGWA